MNTCQPPAKRIPIKQCEYAKDIGGAVWQAEVQWRMARYREIYGVKRK